MVAVVFSVALLLMMLTDTPTAIVQLRSDTIRPTTGVHTQSLRARDKISEKFKLTGAIINARGTHHEYSHTIKVCTHLFTVCIHVEYNPFWLT